MQPLQLRLDHLAHILRGAEIDSLQWCTECPSGVRVENHTTRQEVVDDRDDEQRLPAGMSVDAGCQGRHKVRLGKQHLEISVHRREVEIMEGQCHAAPMVQQCAYRASEDVLLNGNL